MNIGIDVDGVLADIAGYQLRTSQTYFEKLGYSIIDPAGFDVVDIYGCSQKERSDFWHKYIWKYCISEPAIQYAPEIIEQLHDDGHNITIITSRVNTTEKNFLGYIFRKMLLKWLKKNGIYYDRIIYCSEKNSHNDKLNACVENEIDVMIDDKPENLMTIAEKIKVICYPAVWNENLNDTRIIKAKDWREVYTIINDMQGESQNG